MPRHEAMKKVAVIGGGISGLTTAFLLNRKGVDATVFEAADAVGGNVQTIRKEGYTIEQGPNSLLKSPRIVDLVRMLGLESEVIAANPMSGRATHRLTPSGRARASDLGASSPMTM